MARSARSGEVAVRMENPKQTARAERVPEEAPPRRTQRLGPEVDIAARLRTAQEALLSRPRISIRVRLVASLCLCFVVFCAFTLASLDVLHRTRSLFLLGSMLLLFAAITFAFARALGAPIARFKGYTSRIAGGDFSFIRPARRYRDEFSDLAVAVNQMLAELRAQQNRVVKGAKLAAVGTLTSGIAHELNNPLNNISITTEALMEGLSTLSEEEKWRHLQDIYFETERASEIVKSLLDFTRKEKQELVALDLGDVLRSTLRLAHNELIINDVTLVTEVPADLPRVLGVANQMRQVFLNLLINAVQAMPEGGKLTVSADAHDPDKVCIEIRDEGVGIPPEILPRIFDPFFTTKEPGKGTGLGLSVSLGIVRKFGGDIQVESEPGKGTTVHVCLPTAEER